MSQSSPLASYAIGTGFNNGSTTNIEALTPASAQTAWQLGSIFGDSYFYAQSLGSYERPYELTNAPTITQNGFDKAQLRISASAHDALVWFLQTYVEATNGRITLNLRYLSTSYAEKNVIITPASRMYPSQLETQSRGGYLWVTDMVFDLLIYGDTS